jgi:catechol 2,3-dioxygenase-like lactoylglutathione lyase family enzyme
VQRRANVDLDVRGIRCARVNSRRGAVRPSNEEGGSVCFASLRGWKTRGCDLSHVERLPLHEGAAGPGAFQLARTVGGDRRAGCSTRDMTIKRLDHVSVVVNDLAAAVAFFTALGMTPEGEMLVEGPWVDRVNGLESVRVDIVMMRTPDGHGRLELTKFHNPKLVEIEPAVAPPNALGLRSVMFAVESVDDTVARLRANGAELVGEVAQYEDIYKLCYMRGPAGIIVALAEELPKRSPPSEKPVAPRRN